MCNGAYTQEMQLYVLTFRGPCIVIYSYNKSQQDALLLRFVLDRPTVHHQESQHCIHSNRYLSCLLC